MPEHGVMTTMGIDATKPVGEDFEKVTVLPGMEQLPDILKQWSKK